MVQCWFMDDEPSDQRLEHHKSPPEYCSIEELLKRTGVEYFHFPVDTYQKDGKLEELKRKRGYSYEDEIAISKDTLPDYETKIKNFFTEHLHTDEEIRFVVEGSGYFDVRDKEENWVRVAMEPGDMIILPAGIYHRFTLDTNNFIRAKRFFVGEPVWLPYNRPADHMDCRKDYVQKLTDNGFLAV